MKSTELAETQGLRTYLLVMDQGDEAVSRITAFARENGITAASLTAIGAADAAALACFDRETSDYRVRRFTEQLELASCLGDIADHAGEPVLHAHAVLGRQDYSALAGHLTELSVFPTMEVVLTETPAHLRKRRDPRTGMLLISPDDSTGTAAG